MDKSDRNLLLFLVFAVVGVVLILAWIGAEYAPIVATQASQTFGGGIGFKPAAAISFIVTVLLMGFLAFVSDGGILGEVQYLLGSFFFFFVVITLLVAWIF